MHMRLENNAKVTPLEDKFRKQFPFIKDVYSVRINNTAPEDIFEALEKVYKMEQHTLLPKLEPDKETKRLIYTFEATRSNYQPLFGFYYATQPLDTQPPVSLIGCATEQVWHEIREKLRKLDMVR